MSPMQLLYIQIVYVFGSTHVIVHQTRPFSKHSAYIDNVHVHVYVIFLASLLQYSVQLTLCTCIFKYILYLFTTYE